MHASSLFALLFSRRAAARSCWLSLFGLHVCVDVRRGVGLQCVSGVANVCAVCGAGVWGLGGSIFISRPFLT